MVPKPGLAYRIGPYVHRWQPQTLRGRLVLASVLFGIAAAVVTFTLTSAATTMQYNSLSESVAIEQLHAFRTFILLEQSDVGRFAAAVGDVWERRAESSAASAPPETWVADRMRDGRASSLVAVDRSGFATALYGPVGEIDALLRVAAAADPNGRTGLIWVDGSCLVAATRPIMDTSGLIVGRIAVARPLDAAADSRFLPLAEDMSLRLTAPSAIRPATTRSLAGFSNVAVETAGSVSRIQAGLGSIDGSATGMAVITIRDQRLARSISAASAAAVGASLIVGVIGAALGLALSAGVRAPIERTRRHLREEAPNALEGMPCRPMRVRPETTEDFRELATEVDGLLDALTKRHAELLAATDEARAAQATLRAVLDESPEGKLLVENGRMLLANRAAEEILDIPAGELVGMTTEDLAERMLAYTEDGRRLVVADLRAAAEKPLTARVSAAGRPDRWVFVNVIPHAENANRVLVTARDVTEDRRLDALREEVFSLVSHDLRAPLTVVQGYLDILGRPLQPEARERAIASARFNATKMAGLLEDLLDASSAEQLLAPKELVPVDLAVLAGEVAASLQPTAPEHAIVVSAPAPVVVAGENARLRQALVNLVTNAIKYSPEGTSVTLRVESSDGMALAAVEDQGPGIPPEAREAVFDRYGRLPETCAGKPGFGLGLYIVRLIAANHGGRARVEEAPGGGARFVIELPLAETPAA